MVDWGILTPNLDSEQSRIEALGGSAIPYAQQILLVPSSKPISQHKLDRLEDCFKDCLMWFTFGHFLVWGLMG